MAYRVIAQHYVQDRRITKVIEAASMAAALRSAAMELDEAGFYVISISGG